MCSCVCYSVEIVLKSQMEQSCLAVLPVNNSFPDAEFCDLTECVMLFFKNMNISTCVVITQN